MPGKIERVIKYFTMCVFQPGNVKLITEKLLCSFAWKQTIFLLKTNFQILKRNSAFHPRCKGILSYYAFFKTLLSIPFSIWRMISYFSFKDLFLSFLYTADIFLNYDWIKTKFFECHSFEKSSNFSFEPCALNSDYCKTHI